ncbi:MAG TPA: antitoxin VbhA family protein [Silvibacterium sp.]|jgi:hypothetical protein|nr:antitoxin VbhA family protein [Silvibacterium sp.]
MTNETGSNTDRRADVDSVLASFGMEGLTPDTETAGILERYAAGQITLQEMSAAIEAHVKRMEVKEAVSGAV